MFHLGFLLPLFPSPKSSAPQNLPIMGSPKVVVQSFSRAQLFSWTVPCQVSLSFAIFQSLLKLKSIESVMPSNHLILCRPRLLLPSIFPSIRVFSNESALSIRWPKYWSFSISPSNEYSGLISFKIDWFDLAVQGTLKCLPQHHSSKAAVLQCSAFFMIQLSHLHITTGKNIPLTIQTFVGKVISLLFNPRWGEQIGFISSLLRYQKKTCQHLLVTDTNQALYGL